MRSWLGFEGFFGGVSGAVVGELCVSILDRVVHLVLLW
jgi:hypothetical protein